MIVWLSSKAGYLVSADFTHICILMLLSGDFGIARMMENTFDMAQTCCGTPCYLSPELCQDMPYSSKADVWVSSLFSFSYIFR